jgi:O-methyltransferase
MKLRWAGRILKSLIPPIVTEPVRQYRRARRNRQFADIPDRQFYRKVFSPWLGYGEFGPLMERARPYTLVSSDRVWILYALARQALHIEGCFYEGGVFRGGTALVLAELLRQEGRGRLLHLFDTFAGMPETDAVRDLHRPGDFADTSLDVVKRTVGSDPFIVYHPGLIPDTFKGREGDRIVFAHLDLDIYRSMLDACAFIYPCLVQGGFLVFDDYGAMSCPGARQAVDEYFADKPEVPLVLPTGQAVVFKY